jgi:predicted Zn-dependent protease
MSGCEINITWQEIPPAEKPKACGWTVRQIGTEPQRLEIKAVSITLIKFPRIDRALSPVQQQQRLAATVLHELGHALGLDHVQSAAAVMHYQGWQNTRLSDVDINALNRLYPG